MLRTSLVALVMLVPAVAMAAGRPVAETCVNAGYRAGTAAFDMCVARVGGDDPLSALDGGELSAHGDKSGHKAATPDPLAATTPARPVAPIAGVTVPTVREDLPASFNAPTVWGQPVAPSVPPPPPSSPPPPPQNSWWPTPPTAPTLPSVTAPTTPMWNFGSQ
ncbi:MAG: hypothetical protein ACM31D_03115 [Bacteroidota bacterium]